MDKFPDFISGLIWLVKILSMIECLLAFILVGRVITGRRKLAIMFSKKLNESRWEVFDRSKLKSLAMNIFLFSFCNFSFKGFMKSSMNSLRSCRGSGVAVYGTNDVVFPLGIYFFNEARFKLLWLKSP